MKILRAALLILLALTLTGCGRGEPAENEPQGNKIYMTNVSRTRLTVEYDDTEILNTMDQLEYFFARMKTPENTLENFSLFPENVEILSMSMDEPGTLLVHFSAEYAELTPEDEILARSGLVKTMGQLEEVERISIFIEEDPLSYPDGRAVGFLTPEDFVDPMDDISTQVLTLYFANETGDALREEVVEAQYDGSMSLEKMVMLLLIQGPPSDSRTYYPTISPNVQLLNIALRENVCYVNFDSAFIDGGPPVKDCIALYSVINTLTSLPEVDQVQILVNGSSDVVFRENYSLADKYAGDLSYLEGEE